MRGVSCCRTYDGWLDDLVQAKPSVESSTVNVSCGERYSLASMPSIVGKNCQ